MSGRWIGVLAAALLAGGCAGGAAEEQAPPSAAAEGALPPPAPPPAPDPAPAPAPMPRPGGEWTAGITEREDPGVRMTTLTEVRAARNEGFDRVVWEFAGDTLPGYRIEYVDRPVRACGSGEVVPVGGDGWLRVSLSPARAHDDRGRATVEDRALAPGLPVLRELRSLCDFEGHVDWVLGVESPNRYRVLELRDPARLVVDVRH